MKVTILNLKQIIRKDVKSLKNEGFFSKLLGKKSTTAQPTEEPTPTSVQKEDPLEALENEIIETSSAVRDLYMKYQKGTGGTRHMDFFTHMSSALGLDLSFITPNESVRRFLGRLWDLTDHKKVSAGKHTITRNEVYDIAEEGIKEVLKTRTDLDPGKLLKAIKMAAEGSPSLRESRKITKSQLKQYIKEELEKIFQEGIVSEKFKPVKVQVKTEGEPGMSKSAASVLDGDKKPDGTKRTITGKTGSVKKEDWDDKSKKSVTVSFDSKKDGFSKTLSRKYLKKKE